MKAREVKRAKLVAKYAAKRAALKKIVNTGDPVEAFEAAQKLQSIPRNANPVSSESLVFNSVRWHPRVLSPA